MTDLLAEAVAKVARLPDDEQVAFARWLMDELESERRWSRAFEASQSPLGDWLGRLSRTIRPIEPSRSTPIGCDVATRSSIPKCRPLTEE